MLTRIISIFTISLLPLTAFSQPTTDTGRVDSGYPLDDAESAYIRALQYTGFARAMDTSAVEIDEVVRKVKITNDKTPFFHSRINNRDLWQVTLDSVKLKIPGMFYSVLRDQTPKTYQVLLDPQTGQLLRIQSDFTGDSTDVAPEPQPDSATDAMRRSGEQYHALLTSPPKVDFYRALENAWLASPVLAKQVLGVCVEYSSRWIESGPVWIIKGRGTPGGPTSRIRGANRPEANKWLCIVDAITGELVEASSY